MFFSSRSILIFDFVNVLFFFFVALILLSNGLCSRAKFGAHLDQIQLAIFLEIFNKADKANATHHIDQDNIVRIGEIDSIGNVLAGQIAADEFEYVVA